MGDETPTYTVPLSAVVPEQPDVLAEIKTALARMTPGPWEAYSTASDDWGGGRWSVWADDGEALMWEVQGHLVKGGDADNNALGIATLRSLAPTLVERCEQAEHELALIAYRVGERGKTDCSTPLFIRVENIIERCEQAEAKAEQYRQDWMASKTAFGDAMASQRERTRIAESTYHEAQVRIAALEEVRGHYRDLLAKHLAIIAELRRRGDALVAAQGGDAK